MADTKQRQNLTIKFVNKQGEIEERKFDAKTLDYYEFISQGQLLFVQTLGTTKDEFIKTNEMTLNREYFVVKDLISVTGKTMLTFSDPKEKLEMLKKLM